MNKAIVFVTLVVCTLGLVACGDDGGTDETPANNGGETAKDPHALVAEEACEHMADGPEEGVEGGATDADAKAASTYEHTRIDVTMVDEGGENVAFLTFEADEEAEFAFFLSEDIPFAVLDGGGAEVSLEAGDDELVACGEVAVAHLVDLEVGSYTLKLGPASADSVSFVVEAVGGEHDHDHDDKNNHDNHGHDDENNHGHGEENNHGHDEENNHGHEEGEDHNHEEGG